MHILPCEEFGAAISARGGRKRERKRKWVTLAKGLRGFIRKAVTVVPWPWLILLQHSQSALVGFQYQPNICDLIKKLEIRRCQVVLVSPIVTLVTFWHLTLFILPNLTPRPCCLGEKNSGVSYPEVCRLLVRRAAHILFAS